MVSASRSIGLIKAVYPMVWGVLQVATGPLSDRFGRKELIAWGMIVQAGGIWLTVLVPTYGAWLVGAALQGLGTAMVYPTLLAAITDHAHPTWRATRASASTDSGATSATPSARCSPVSSRTSSGLRRRFTWSRR